MSEPLCMCIQTKATGEIDTSLCSIHTPATVPAPRAEAEAAWKEHAKDHPSVTGIGGADIRKAFIAGYLRGRGDRG